MANLQQIKTCSLLKSQFLFGNRNLFIHKRHLIRTKNYAAFKVGYIFICCEANRVCLCKILLLVCCTYFKYILSRYYNNKLRTNNAKWSDNICENKLSYTSYCVYVHVCVQSKIYFVQVKSLNFLPSLKKVPTK